MNRYSQYSSDQLNELFSNYLIDSWSYSKVSCFARNEKAFEMNYVYCEKEKRSVSSIAGNAYHEALKAYFLKWHIMENTTVLVDLTAEAYNYLDEIPANDWKLTDKFPTVEQAKTEAVRLATALIENFVAEIDTYIADIARVVSVEEKKEAWVTCNGVDIPLPLHYIIDLVVETKDGKTIIVDHKSKGAYTSEEEIALKHGKQAITYVLGFEENNPDSHIDEVWFFENKYSKNKDKSAQIRKYSIVMDEDSRRLYEWQLYVPLKRMIEAVGDPDYIYTINDTDNLTDASALHEFEMRTLISEVEDFAFIPENKKDLIAKRQRKIKDSSIAMISPKVIRDFRKTAASFITFDYSHSNMTSSEKIEHAFRTFGKQVSVAHEIKGFSCNTYLCEVAAGVQLGQLNTYSKDIAYALDVPTVRIASNLAMYEGKSYLSIEVNLRPEERESLAWDESYINGHRIPIGLDNYRQPVVWDLDNNSTPHMLVCGSTGSGKSVMIKSTIEYAKKAGIEDIIILDPKAEFTDIEGVEDICDIDAIEEMLMNLVTDMNNRIKNKEKHLTLVLFDEFADAQDQSKEIHRKDKTNPVTPMEVTFKMLLQKGRSCGFRFLAATQRADTKTISGTTKVNFPIACCFRVPKAIDSKVVIDEEGANALAGRGDGLLKSPEYLDQLVRFQGFYRA